MGKYTIEVPDGRKLTIEADDEETAIAGAQDWVSQNPKPPMVPLGEATAPFAGLNEGVDMTLSLPGQALNLVGQGINYGAETLGFEAPLPAEPFKPVKLASQANVDYEPQTAFGRYGKTIGQVAGGSIAPEAAISLKIASMTPQALRLAAPIIERIAKMGPLQSLKSSISPTVGAGVGVQAARDAELGPVGETVAGIAGSFAAPFASIPVARTASGVKQAARYGSQAVRSATRPEQYAIETTADRLVAAGVEPAAIRSRISPEMSSNLRTRGFTEADIADIISRQLKGEPAESVARSYAHLVDDQGRSFTAETARNYLNRYEASNPTPLDITDISTQIAGEGGAMPVKRLGRAAYSLSGDESGEAAQALMSRQETQPGRVASIIERAVGGGDFEATRTAGLKRLDDEATEAYRQFHKEPELATKELGDLMDDPIFRQAVSQAEQQARIETIKRNQTAARTGQPQDPPLYTNKNDPQVRQLRQELNDTKDALRAARRRRQDAATKEEKRAALEETRTHEDTVTAIEREIKELLDADPEVFSPLLLDLIQRQLRIRSQGFANDPNAARHAGNLREVFLDRIEQHYPTFREIRRNYATGKGEYGEQGALEAGADLTTRLGAKSRDALRGYDQMTPAQQELFRLGFAERLKDMAANRQIGGAVANQFDTTAVREIVERLYPKSDARLWKQGQELIEGLRTEALTTRNKNYQLVGARSAELGSDMERLMQGADAAADVITGRWGNLLHNLSARLKTQLGQRGATEAMRILTETDPAELLPLLNRLEEAAASSAARRQGVLDARQLRSDNLGRLNAPAAVGTSVATGR